MTKDDREVLRDYLISIRKTVRAIELDV
jgi:hypothetical protein